MQIQLEDSQKEALNWLKLQVGPVFSFKRGVIDIKIIQQLIKFRLVKVSTIITHPKMPHINVSCFALTKKGKRYHKKLFGDYNNASKRSVSRRSQDRRREF